MNAMAQALKQELAKMASPEEQKDFLRSLKETVVCDAEHVVPEPGAGHPDVCRMEGSVSISDIADLIVAGGAPRPSEVVRYFNSQLKQRICFLDGGMATRIQAEKLEEADYRGDRFKDFNEIDANGVPVSLKGNNDLLCFTKPDLIKDIHKEYFLGGSDICETNTFNGTSISQGEYKCQSIVYELNKVASELAKKAAAEVTKAQPEKPRFVAGAVCPTSRTLSVSPSVEDPSYRNVTWDELVDSYKEQVRGLVDGGCDLLMIETIFDTQNSKAAIFAVDQYFLETGKERLPVTLSATIVDNSGRTLSGQTIEGFFISVKHAKPFTVGINCALGAAQMKGFYKKLTDLCPGWCHVYPNAGLPNAMGGYDEDPEIFSTNVYDYAKDGLLNFVGGCCGTFASHIAAVVEKVKNCPVRKLPELPKYPYMQLSGLEPCFLKPEDGFQWVGERCNLMGSAKFKKLVDAYKWDEAMEVCLAQCEKKADILDFNFDSDLIVGKSAMGKFMRLCVTEPTVAKLPFMIDSSKWSVIEEGLKCVQGKSIVNSISLKVGEEEFLRQAKLCMRYGAAVVVMAFDEQGQAATFEDKVRICQRSYNLMRTKLDFPPEDIIFDCNVLTIATGLPEHNSYGIDFINAVAEIKRTCPCVSFSGGLSNLSFSFRGLNTLRDAMHSVFLYHCIPKGLNMSIVNPGGLPRCTDIDSKTRSLCEEVILNKSADGKHVERFLEFAELVKNPPKEAAPAAGGAAGGAATGKDAWRNGTYTERLHHGLIHGIDKFIDGDVEEARQDLQILLKVIEGPLMRGMGIIGDLFGAGKMFLPQVIKSARVMKKAVAWLIPFMEEEKRAAALLAGEDPNQPKYNGVVLMATVKGDVHDIGKNIVGVVLGCNNFKVIDMGVMVPCEKILDRAIEEKVDVIGLSGLITPSLDEMVYVAEQMKVRNMKQPLMIGGATTSKRHTAVKLATKYDHGVIHVLDASRSCTVVSSCLSGEKQSYLEDLSDEYKEIREEYYATLIDKKWHTLNAAQNMKPQLDWSKVPPKPKFTGNMFLKDYPIKEIIEYIDWTPFFQVYQLRGKYPNRDYPAIFKDERVGPEAKKLFDEAKEMLDWVIKENILQASGVVGIWPANTVGDDIQVYEDESREKVAATFYGLRQQLDMGESEYWCQSDFIAPKGVAPDYIAAFANTGGLGCHEQRKKFEETGDIDKAILLEAIADRLAEAFAELIHLKIRKEMWGYAPDENLSLDDMLKVRYQGIRPAPGYPSQPDHREKKTMWDLLDIDKLSGGTLQLTESYTMLPGASVSALVFAHPEAKYFSVGQVNKDQVEAYAARRGEGGVEGTERWLGSTVLGYEKK
nr:B12-dependent methionine synthase [Margalefidinium polykrikoides]